MRALLVLLALAAPASAAASSEDDWLTGLTDRVVDDLTAGKSLNVLVHVPLCDNTIIACGNAKLGDGDTPSTNLYWSTTPGFGQWFQRKGSGWTRVSVETKDTGDKDVLEKHIYRRTIATPAAWRKRGAPKQFTLEVEIRAWRGSAIDRALAAYANDVSGKGSSAQLVAFVGHNRLMDLDTFAWPEPGKDVKGAIAIACDTAPYMKKQVSAATRVPLLMTADLLFANAAPLEAAVLAFARGGGYAQIRKDAATAYAGVRKRPVEKVIGAFTNPGDRRW
ncbi:MAG TPA: hypothetical protein VFV99_30500 [Kofleriaceae bacterium]|nr:hypothetical protein [Kofleriaceae bacterium]